ncbi:MAG: hypothetical protein WA771_10080 [Chthoniobacterales bacterium]
MKPVSPTSAGPTPAAVKPAAKKETAKISPMPASAPKPQATVRLQQANPAAAAPAFTTDKSPVPVEADTSDEPDMNLSAVAAVAAVLALLVQVWFLMG